MLHVVDTHVFNGARVVLEILDIEVYHFDAQLTHVGDHVFGDLLCYALPVLDHLLQPHRTDDLPHIALQHLGDHADQLRLAHPQQGFRGPLQQLCVRGDFDIGHAVYHYVDELVGGDSLTGFHVHLHHTQR